MAFKLYGVTKVRSTKKIIVKHGGGTGLMWDCTSAGVGSYGELRELLLCFHKKDAAFTLGHWMLSIFSNMTMIPNKGFRQLHF